MIELAYLLFIAGVIVMLLAITFKNNIVLCYVFLFLGTLIAFTGILIIPESIEVHFCEEEMNGIYESNKGLKTCTINEDGNHLVYKLIKNENGQPQLARFASQGVDE